MEGFKNIKSEGDGVRRALYDRTTGFITITAHGSSDDRIKWVADSEPTHKELRAVLDANGCVVLHN